MLSKNLIQNFKALKSQPYAWASVLHGSCDRTVRKAPPTKKRNLCRSYLFWHCFGGFRALGSYGAVHIGLSWVRFRLPSALFYSAFQISKDVASETREISIKTSRTKDLSAVMYRLGVCNIRALRLWYQRRRFLFPTKCNTYLRPWIRFWSTSASSCTIAIYDFMYELQSHVRFNVRFQVRSRNTIPAMIVPEIVLL